MTGEALPEDVVAFVVRVFRSIAELEAALLLLGEPSRAWTTQAVAARLYVSVEEAEQVLAYLEACRLARSDPDGVRYAPGSDDDDRAFRRVARHYATHLIPVTKLIHARPASRIREFADAFKLKKAD